MILTLTRYIDICMDLLYIFLLFIFYINDYFIINGLNKAFSFFSSSMVAIAI